MNCPHCKYNNSKNYLQYCEKCGKILPINTSNYFDIFAIAESFEVDLPGLEKRLYALQALNHPDKFIQASIKEKDISTHNSSIINQGYKVLKNVHRRAEYMLKLNEIDISHNTPSVQMLEEAMEWREKLGNLKNESEIKDLLEEITKLELQKLNLIREKFAKKLYTEAQEVYININFINRFKQEIEKQLNSSQSSLDIQ
ncbi:Co-chaperone protein HscB [Reticulomyxa filosa]|uniref:Co-chaperone protein HscB n=1 Tax=Reticulomyxa filosa TaxID=46433 RepID=X6LL24_RETFI|nr:Co-chaperone protein HscB [Reticulomyxa filosa]|eukprot:ETO01395.1 Co-chaperone protein HscB [Reticulomyxa filosa]